MKNLISKHLQNVVHLRSHAIRRSIGSNGRPLDRPIFIVYGSEGRVVDIFSLQWLKYIATNRPSYFNDYYTELRYFF